MKCVDGGYDTTAPPRHDRDERDRKAVLNIAAMNTGPVARELLDILGLLPTAVSMRAEFREPVFVAPEPVVIPPVRRTRRKKDEPIVHGTNAGYQAHRGFHEAPCDPCREAATAYNRETRKGGTR